MQLSSLAQTSSDLNFLDNFSMSLHEKFIMLSNIFFSGYSVLRDLTQASTSSTTLSKSLSLFVIYLSYTIVQLVLSYQRNPIIR